MVIGAKFLRIIDIPQVDFLAPLFFENDQFVVFEVADAEVVGGICKFSRKKIELIGRVFPEFCKKQKTGRRVR